METITLKLQDLEELFQAGRRFGYSERSKMEGAQGSDDPNFEGYLAKYFPQFLKEYKDISKY